MEIKERQRQREGARLLSMGIPWRLKREAEAEGRKAGLLGQG
jgi:hypothetical protein